MKKNEHKKSCTKIDLVFVDYDSEKSTPEDVSLKALDLPGEDEIFIHKEWFISNIERQC